MLKQILLAALAAIPLTSCFATAADLDRIALKVDDLAVVLDNPLATEEEVDEAVTDLKEEAHAVTAEVRARQEELERLATTAGLSATQVGLITTVVTILAGVANNLYRDRKHAASDKVVKEETKAEVKTEIKAAGGVA